MIDALIRWVMPIAERYGAWAAPHVSGWMPLVPWMFVAFVLLTVAVGYGIRAGIDQLSQNERSQRATADLLRSQELQRDCFDHVQRVTANHGGNRVEQGLKGHRAGT